MTRSCARLSISLHGLVRGVVDGGGMGGSYGHERIRLHVVSLCMHVNRLLEKSTGLGQVWRLGAEGSVPPPARLGTV